MKLSVGHRSFEERSLHLKQAVFSSRSTTPSCAVRHQEAAANTPWLSWLLVLGKKAPEYWRKGSNTLRSFMSLAPQCGSGSEYLKPFTGFAQLCWGILSPRHGDSAPLLPGLQHTLCHSVSCIPPLHLCLQCHTRPSASCQEHEEFRHSSSVCLTFTAVMGCVSKQ